MLAAAITGDCMLVTDLIGSTGVRLISAIMRRLIGIALLLLGLAPVAAQVPDEAAEKLVRQYVEARSQTMQESATNREIERALSFCTEGFVYEHPSLGAKIEGKERAGSGIRAYLGQTKNATYTLQILASNPYVVVARVDQRFQAKQENGTWAPANRLNITVFEIAGGRIARILDY